VVTTTTTTMMQDARWSTFAWRAPNSPTTTTHDHHSSQPLLTTLLTTLSLSCAVYARLDVDKRLLLRGESFYNDKIPAVVEEMTARGLAVESEGALVVHVPGKSVPLMLRKGDGGFGYDSTDLAAIHYRLHTSKRDWLVYVVDSGQVRACVGWMDRLPSQRRHRRSRAASAAAASFPPSLPCFYSWPCAWSCFCLCRRSTSTSCSRAPRWPAGTTRPSTAWSTSASASSR